MSHQDRSGFELPELRAAGAQISYRNFVFLSPNFTIFLENFLRAARNLMQNETQTLYIPTIYGKTWHLILCKYIHTRRDHNAEEALFGVRAQSRRVSAKESETLFWKLDFYSPAVYYREGRP